MEHVVVNLLLVKYQILTLLLMIVPSSRHRWLGPGSSTLSLLQESIHISFSLNVPCFFLYLSTLIVPPHWKNTAWFCVQYLGLLTTLGNLRNQSQIELSGPTIWKSATDNKSTWTSSPQNRSMQRTRQRTFKNTMPSNFPDNSCSSICYSRYYLWIWHSDLRWHQFYPRQLSGWANHKVIDLLIKESLQQQGCISCGILLSGTWARGVSSEHMENMEMFSCSPT